MNTSEIVTCEIRDFTLTDNKQELAILGELNTQKEAFSLVEISTANGQQSGSADIRGGMSAQGQIGASSLHVSSRPQNNNLEQCAEEKKQAPTQQEAVTVTTQAESSVQNEKETFVADQTANSLQKGSLVTKDALMPQRQIGVPPLHVSSRTQNDNHEQCAEEKKQTPAQQKAVTVTTEAESRDQNNAVTTPTNGKPRTRASLEERFALIEKRREILNRKAASLKKEARKQRDGQLIAWGIMTELLYKDRKAQAQEILIKTATKYLKERELKRALSGFKRLDAEIAEKESKCDQETQA